MAQSNATANTGQVPKPEALILISGELRNGSL